MTQDKLNYEKLRITNRISMSVNKTFAETVTPGCVWEKDIQKSFAKYLKAPEIELVFFKIAGLRLQIY